MAAISALGPGTAARRPVPWLLRARPGPAPAMAYHSFLADSWPSHGPTVVPGHCGLPGWTVGRRVGPAGGHKVFSMFGGGVMSKDGTGFGCD